jgi:hypothetical protein
MYNAVGKPVTYNYPGKIKRKGILKDRCVYITKANIACDDAIYTDTVDLIEFDIDGKKLETIRFGYYRNRNWAGQWTLTDSTEVLKKLFIKAAKEKPWFKKFLEDIVKEI